MTPSFTETDAIDSVIVCRPGRYSDARGHLTEFFRRDEMDCEAFPAMGYISVTNPGFSRGPHEHVDQTDTFFFPGPGGFIVALWDNRENSPDFGKRMILKAGESNPCVLTVPPGVVHAYGCVSKSPGTVINIPNRLYRGEGKRQQVDEIRHEDDPSNPFAADFAHILGEKRA